MSIPTVYSDDRGRRLLSVLLRIKLVQYEDVIILNQIISNFCYFFHLDIDLNFIDVDIYILLTLVLNN